MVTHVHGAVGVADDSDGYAEAWYLPAANGIPADYATVGTWYDFFAGKAATNYGVTWGSGFATFQYPPRQRKGTSWPRSSTKKPRQSPSRAPRPGGTDRRAMTKKTTRLLFVCYANICRSPMAEGIARKRLGPAAEVRSAGIAATGGPASENAVLVMKLAYGGHLRPQRPPGRPFRRGVVRPRRRHGRLSLQPTPGHLGSAGTALYCWDIEDPVGLGYDAFKETALKIERRLEQFLAAHGLDG